MMKPRAVIRDVNDAGHIPTDNNEDTTERQTGNPFKDGTNTSSHDLEEMSTGVIGQRFVSPIGFV